MWETAESNFDSGLKTKKMSRVLSSVFSAGAHLFRWKTAGERAQ